jgi:hypothetical protein
MIIDKLVPILVSALRFAWLEKMSSAYFLMLFKFSRRYKGTVKQTGTLQDAKVLGILSGTNLFANDNGTGLEG